MNASRKLQNAKGLYLEGIRDGRVREAVTKYTGKRYTQHSTGVGDGIEGFVAFFEPFVGRNTERDIRIVRALVDGPYVFLHVYQDINGGQAKWVTADIFDTDENDKIVEHWDVIQAFEEETVSGRTMVGGPTQILDLDKTEDNKTLVKGFFDDVLIGGNINTITSYISEKEYAQHNPSIADGLDGFARYAKELADKGIVTKYLKLHLLVGQGNFVAALSHTQVGNDEWAFIDLFRLAGGKIVEHWDIQEKILPEDQWGNSGKY